ncbi:uncharacterized protein [Physcomitrium patens]|uniref:uncharacterized protein n=1 Tax=Physcomitrium patens TaxID=3218 RepID=UPI003CCD8CCA
MQHESPSLLLFKTPPPPRVEESRSAVQCFVVVFLRERRRWRRLFFSFPWLSSPPRQVPEASHGGAWFGGEIPMPTPHFAEVGGQAWVGRSFGPHVDVLRLQHCRRGKHLKKI